MTFPWRSTLTSLLLALGTSACGRPATVSDCEEIVERIVRLELEATGPGDSEKLAAEVNEFKARVRERTLEACVGKPVTERSLACARAATKPKAVEACFFSVF
ncbi:MAG: hypothetical protein JW751_29095 [Polyangiaceae bacterium]|nr:hypothetical protein [Polyangiaceae bacterium]